MYLHYHMCQLCRHFETAGTSARQLCRQWRRRVHLHTHTHTHTRKKKNIYNDHRNNDNDKKNLRFNNLVGIIFQFILAPAFLY